MPLFRYFVDLCPNERRIHCCNRRGVWAIDRCCCFQSDDNAWPICHSAPIPTTVRNISIDRVVELLKSYALRSPDPGPDKLLTTIEWWCERSWVTFEARSATPQ